jgi:hypothetical protein
VNGSRDVNAALTYDLINGDLTPAGGRLTQVCDKEMDAGSFVAVENDDSVIRA